MDEGIQTKTLATHATGDGIQTWGTSTNPGDWKGIGVNKDCCPCECGCPDSVLCFREGEILKATITSDCLDIDPDGNGMIKYFIVGEGYTHEGNGCWAAMQDGSYDDCLILNPGPGHDPTLICCDNEREFCEDAQGCMRYYLVLRAYECHSEEQIICATNCDCGESGKGFFLEFNDIELDGSPQQGTPPPDPPPIYYLCGCDCEWPITINIRVERLLECCCTSLEDPAVPGTLLATINGPDGEPCGGEMEGASTTLEHDDSVCREWTSVTPFSFHCGDGETYYSLELEMVCPDVDEGEGTVSGGCCDDFLLTVTWNGDFAGCDETYTTQTKGVVNNCTCLPLNLKFGPFKLWTDPAESGCECCEEFYITITDPPS